jgi:GH15 family glucan-1,4-alpha-glucosidase
MFGLDGPVEHWRELRDAVHKQVCERGFDRKRKCFVQSYDSQELDASLLMIPLVGFLPPDDPRMHGTVEAIERHLLRDGFVARYDTRSDVDGLPAGEGAFLPCTFWLADNLAAFSHVGLVNTALNLHRPAEGASEKRRQS